MGTDFRKLYDKEYLYAFDLGGKPATLTIEKVIRGTLVGEGGKSNKKPVIYFKEGKEKKGLACNITNGRAIASMYGVNIEDWIGKRITIYPTTTTFGPKTVECIRVRAPSGKAGNEPPLDELDMPDPGAVQ
jgi:hypothetical protein